MAPWPKADGVIDVTVGEVGLLTTKFAVPTPTP